MVIKNVILRFGTMEKELAVPEGFNKVCENISDFKGAYNEAKFRNTGEKKDGKEIFTICKCNIDTEYD